MAEAKLINIIIYYLVMSMYSSFIINNCTFMDNSASSGGALYIYGD